jgi:hypothetical protein
MQPTAYSLRPAAYGPTAYTPAYGLRHTPHSVRGAELRVREDFPRVHDVQRVQCALDGAHHRDGAFAGLFAKESHLVQPDAVFARAGAAQRKRAVDERVIQPFSHTPVLGVVGIDQVAEVEVAVADMSEQLVRQPRGLGLLGRGEQAVGQS